MMERTARHRANESGERGTLYVVGTPIGNLRDMSFRAIEVLKQVDVVAAEDTRVSVRLLQHYGITAKLVSLHEHNEARSGARLLQLILQGHSVALISDAGTPGISDPGARLVSAVRAEGCSVTPVPGASAVVAALSVSGLAAERFLFYGFPSPRSPERRKELGTLAHYDCTLVFFESPHRIEESVRDMALILGGERHIVIARELTKLFESVHACPLKDAASWLCTDDHRRKGEFVLVVQGAPAVAPAAEDAFETLEILLSELPLKQAVALASRISGAKRNALYARALEMKNQSAAR
jgi:16S rRNA (cytidine1402-2'-O)-methyltransferase